MKIRDQKDIWTACGACGKPVDVVIQCFSLGNPAQPNTLHEYNAGLYHNREHQVNLCDAQCAVLFKQKLLDKAHNS